MKRRPIRGYRGPISGRGGKDGGGGKEASDSVFSTSYAKLVDLISEGEIEGLVDGLKSIYYNEVPLQNPDGSYNFRGVVVEWRYGTQGQSEIRGFDSVENEILVSTDLSNASPLIRSITNTNVDAVKVRISIPALQQAQDDGDIVGTSVQVAIDLQSNGGGYVEKVNQTIRGKSSRKFERQYEVSLEGDPPWDIRVRRVTADNGSATLQNSTRWESYTEVIDAKLRYPNSAIIATKIDSAQFSTVPRRAYHVKLLRVRVPSNYDAATRTYTGAWDGTFQIAWTNNPAWCFYDLVTNERYGLGKYVPEEQVDKWGLYQIAQYCDELVPDGKGGTEPRFTCNVYWQTRQEAYKVLNDMASIFRSMLYWGAGSLVVTQDRPGDAVHLFTAANVSGGVFNYSGASKKARHTVALVTWNDPNDFYRQKVEYVEDTDGIERYGIIQTEVVAIGCSSQGQANRVGRWLLFSERLETEAVTFRTGLEGALAAPGDIIKIADPARSGVRLGGRITAAGLSSVTLDSSVTLAEGQTYTLSVLTAAGEIVERTVTTAAGTVDTLDVSPDFDSVPPVMAIWVLSSDAVEATTWRVISVAEAERGVYEFTALAHNASKYDAIELGYEIQVPTTSTLRARPASPENVTIDETLYEAAGGVETLVTIAWDAVSGAAEYRVSYTVDEGNRVDAVVTVNELEIFAARAGYYQVEVVAVNTAGIRSVPSPTQAFIGGNLAPPVEVDNFALAAVGPQAFLTWDLHPDLDVRVGGRIAIRYSSLFEDATWQQGVAIGEFPGGATSGVVPLLSGTYMAKAVDAFGVYSTDETLIVTDVASVQAFNAIEARAEQTDWTGTKTDTYVDAGVLKLSNGDNIDSYLDNIDDWDFIDVEGGLAVSGEYAIGEQIDLGNIYTSRLSARIKSYAYDVADLWDSRSDDIDNWGNVDGDVVEDAAVQIYMRLSADAPVDNNWSPWRPFVVGDYTARSFDFKLVLSRTLPTSQIGVEQFEVQIDMPDRQEYAEDVTVPNTGLAVEYAKAFREIPVLSVTAQDLATGDYIVITAKSVSGFTVQVKNSAGTGVERTIDWLAVGYGYQSDGVVPGEGGTQTGGGALTVATPRLTVVGRSAMGTVTSATQAEAAASGGLPPYTYSWERLSGDPITINTPTEFRTSFRAAPFDGETYEGTFKCTVTDGAAATAETAVITVRLTRQSFD